MKKPFNPDDKDLKNKVVSVSGNSGGMLVGNRHSESGIKAVNKSTGQPLEMEGGEVVITRNAVSDPKRREFNGEMLTNRQILSKINESGGGVSFAESGMEVPKGIKGKGAKYRYDGCELTDYEIIDTIYQSGGNIKTMKNKIDSVANKLTSDLECDGATHVLSQYLDDNDIKHDVMYGEIIQTSGSNEINKFFPHYWIETTIDGDPVIIDYKAQMWMGKTAPNGVISKKKLNNFKYNGIKKYLQPKAKAAIYNLQNKFAT